VQQPRAATCAVTPCEGGMGVSYCAEHAAALPQRAELLREGRGARSEQPFPKGRSCHATQQPVREHTFCIKTIRETANLIF